MKRFALIGHPLDGSGSPELFSKAYNSKWPYDLLDEPDFALVWDIFLKNYTAINITAPFKEKAFEKVDHLSNEAKELGAINIAVKTPCGTIGYNSDYLAVRTILQRRGIGKGACAVVAGAGGAGKAAFAAAQSLGIETLICNRSVKVLQTSSGTKTTIPLSKLPSLCQEADVLIYTLPICPQLAGLQKEAKLQCSIILEASYKAPCLQNSATKEYISGREWLMEQARQGYSLMTGEIPVL